MSMRRTILLAAAALLLALCLAAQPALASSDTEGTAPALGDMQSIIGVGPLDMPPYAMILENWTPNSIVLVTIDNPLTKRRVDHAMTAMTDEAGWWSTGDLPYAWQSGDIVTARLGAFVKTLVVADVHVTDIDGDTDVVTGTCEPGTDVNVGVSPSGSSSGWEIGVWTTADGNGVWQVDFGALGYDIQPGVVADAMQWEEDGDWTWASRYLPE